MRVAVPLFGKRVAPYFGSSSKMLFIEVRNDKIIARTVSEIGKQDAMSLARQMVASGVEKLICGGIQRNHKQWLILNGVHVLDNQKGIAEELITAMNKTGFLSSRTINSHKQII